MSILRLLALLSACVFARPTGFLDRTVPAPGGARRYQVYVPSAWTRHRRWPVILFLHGVGERGSDGLRQTQVGLGSAIRLHSDRFPAVVVFPQCPAGEYWTNPDAMKEAMDALAAAIKEFHGDRKRLYLTGLSMGGYGAWAAADRHPGLFAAITVVSGGIEAVPALSLPAVVDVPPGQDPYAAVAAAVGATPVWIFHGAQDPILSVDGSRRMAALLKAAHPYDRYTEYPGVGHDAWDTAYADEDWARWLFSQSLP